MLFLAVQRQDIDLFKSAYSSRMQEEFARKNWRVSFRACTELFREQLGDYSPEDFRYSFSGTNEEGVVETVFKGRALSGMRVVKEGDSWKLDEM